MTKETTVEFETENPRDIPFAGQRKRARVNGRVETLYVRSVSVRAWKTHEFDGKVAKVVRYWRGSYTMTPDDGLWS